MNAMNSQARGDNIRDMLLDAAGLSLDRLPMLHVIFDRVSTYCADGLRQLAASQCYYSMSHIENGRIGDVLEEYEGNAVVGVFHAPGWDSHVIVGFDRDFVFTMVEALFGSDGSEPPIDDERAFTNIELSICRALFEMVGKAMKESFSLVTDTTFKFERLETRLDFAVIGRRNNQSVVAKFLLQAINRGGEMFVMIPQSALTPMRQTLARAFTGDSSVRDATWVKQIQTEVQKTTVTLNAILESRKISLEEISNLKVGQVLQLSATPKTQVKLEGNNQPLFWCQLGQADGVYKLRIEDMVDREQEFYDDILSG
ncbi:flagellar motor switch protein FliM [Amorphus orientalis]|uniref:Flagellar motor switch protein FliM n=1 Tax=Amorphus orientalis TaxID=649198 RepID=A0AAE3VSH4_9HYPH|nr:FliM/FliN family flagellar motor switch protein [Amorphus orientalis]MDQ0317584.1 flagellar motor switch protein FliM [Amorphus orientalis]